MGARRDGGGQMRVRVCASVNVLTRWSDPVAALGPDERRRAALFRRSQDSEDFIAAHLLARECIGDLLARLPGKVRIGQRCVTCGGPHGRPAPIDGATVSWSHSAGWVIAAAGDRAVGVDVESRAANVLLTPQLLRRTGTAVEREQIVHAHDPADAFLRLWVGKEALVKAGAMTLDDFGSTALADVDGYVLRFYGNNSAVAALAVAVPQAQ